MFCWPATHLELRRSQYVASVGQDLCGPVPAVHLLSSTSPCSPGVCRGTASFCRGSHSPWATTTQSPAAASSSHCSSTGSVNTPPGGRQLIWWQRAACMGPWGRLVDSISSKCVVRRPTLIWLHAALTCTYGRVQQGLWYKLPQWLSMVSRSPQHPHQNNPAWTSSQVLFRA